MDVSLLVVVHYGHQLQINLVYPQVHAVVQHQY